MSFSRLSLVDVTLAVLAGGEGARMGMAKGLLQVNGRPILEHLLEQFAWPGPTALITAPGREHPPAWQRFDCEWADPIPGQGPLRGVLTALEHAATEWVAVLTVDMPRVGREQVDTLLGSISNNDLGRMYRHSPVGSAPRIEPFPLLIRNSAAALVRGRINSGKLSVVKLLEVRGFAPLDAPVHWSDAIWTNLNRPEDLPTLHGQVI